MKYGSAWLKARRLGFVLDVPTRRLMPRQKARFSDGMLIVLAALCWLAAGIWAFCTGQKTEFP